MPYFWVYFVVICCNRRILLWLIEIKKNEFKILSFCFKTQHSLPFTDTSTPLWHLKSYTKQILFHQSPYQLCLVAMIYCLIIKKKIHNFYLKSTFHSLFWRFVSLIHHCDPESKLQVWNSDIENLFHLENLSPRLSRLWLVYFGMLKKF